MEGTKRLRLATAVDATNSSVEKDLRSAGDLSLRFGVVCTSVPESPRQARKEGTDVGWCLRAELHQDVDSSSLLLGSCLQLPSGSTHLRVEQRSPGSPSRAVGRERREVSPALRCDRGGGPAVRSTFGSMRPGSSADRCWPGATLRPPEGTLRSSRDEISTAYTQGWACARGVGRRKFPSGIHRTCFVAPRHEQGQPEIRPRGFVW